MVVQIKRELRPSPEFRARRSMPDGSTNEYVITPVELTAVPFHFRQNNSLLNRYSIPYLERKDGIFDIHLAGLGKSVSQHGAYRKEICLEF